MTNHATFQGRREDHRLTTGAGCFTDDWRFTDALRAAFVRSDHAHGVITGVDIAEALAAPGVIAVLTGQDMAAAQFMRGAPLMPFRDATGPIRAPLKPALAVDRVRYVGEPVAVVIAETQAQALDAAELVVLEIDALDAVVDVTRAIGADVQTLHDEVPKNLCFDYAYGDSAATEAAFASAAHVVDLDLESARVVANPLEPKAAVAAWDGDILDLYTPSQGLNMQRPATAVATGTPPERVRLHAADVGGAFGVRGQLYPEYVAIALAARHTGRVVKWVASRSETFVSDYQGRGIRMKGRLALDAQGRFLALHHDWLCDIGAHASAAGPITCLLTSEMACGAYRIPAMSGRKRLVLTNKVPMSAYRGAGRPEMAYAVERIVDAAARQTGIDRLELRRLNMIPKDAFPYPVTTAPMPVSYDSGDFAELMQVGLKAADWAGFNARRMAAADRGMVRGIGCALFIEPAGGTVPSDEAAITFDADGGIILHGVSVSSGQGHETVIPEIAGRVLGIDPTRITLRAGQTDGPVLKGGGAVASRTLTSMGSVMAAASEAMLAKAMVLAAGVLDIAEADVDYSNGVFTAPGTNRFISLTDLILRDPAALETRAELPSPRTFPSGMHVAEVEIDPDTGHCKLIDYISVDDCGTIINETLVHGQILGGLLQGLGQVFGEIAAYDDEGQLLNASFMDYVMPRADLAPKVKILMAGVPSPANRLGAKGVGEAGTVGALPAAMNAILDALAPLGVTAFDMPASPSRIWHAIQDAKGRA